MACVALTSLMATIKLEFLQPNNPRVSLDDEAFISINSLFEKLSSLQGFVQEKSGAIRDLEIQIRDFALDAEDRIEIQLSNFLLAIKNPEDQQKAYQQQLHQTLGEAAQNAAELLEKSKETDDEEEEVVNESEGPLIPWLKHDSVSEPSNIMVGRRRDFFLICLKLFCGSTGLEVLSIVGMPGIGKTTLARSFYENEILAKHYDVRSWVSMPGEYNVSQMLHHLLWTLTEADDDEIKKGSIPDDDDLATEQVYKCLKDQNQGSRMHYRPRRVYTFR